jgi:hypothetical protein
MSIRRTTKPRRVVAAVSMTAALALAVTGCGGDSGETPKNPESSSSKLPEGDEGTTDDTAAGENVDQNAKLAEVNGRDGLVMVINEVKRDSGGFVTVSAVIQNEGDGIRSAGQWAGTESTMVIKNPNSVAGATLVDKIGKKRYYVLRDTDGRCLCTTGLSAIQPDKSVSVFMQFPAPPSTTTEVDFTLPTFATASLKISE